MAAPAIAAIVVALLGGAALGAFVWGIVKEVRRGR